MNQNNVNNLKMDYVFLSIGADQSWNIVNWTFSNKFRCNLNQISYIFNQENAFGNVVCKMAAILPQP